MGLQDFQIIAKLGSGVYSSVYKVRREVDGENYALKKVKLKNLTEKQKQNALNQAIILASINHPNIIGYREAFIDEESTSLCIIMQFADDGDLYQKILKKSQSKQLFQEQFVWKTLISTLKGLKRLHEKKIIHRDLKSANIFLNRKGQIKIGDLNVSKLNEKGLCSTQTGTPYYASPEVWKDQPYGAKSDIWSLGCIIYELACLKPPFQGQDMEELYKQVTKGIYLKIPSAYSADLCDILRLMLQTDPHIRPSAETLLNSSILKKIMKQNNEKKLYLDVQFRYQSNPQVIKFDLIKKKNLMQLNHHLPEANYSRNRVKTLHDVRQSKSRVQTKNSLSKQSLNCNFTPQNNRKAILFEQSQKRQKFILPIYKKSHCKILSKRNNVIELARKQVIRLQNSKLKEIQQRICEKPSSFRINENIYMKKLIKNRIKIDTLSLLQKISVAKQNIQEKTNSQDTDEF